MSKIRKSIEKDEFPAFIKSFMKNYFSNNIPMWIKDALKSVNISDL